MVTQNCNIRELGRRVASLSEAVSDLYVVTNNSEPDFGSNSAENLETPDYIKLRALLNDTANDLILLVNGPRQTIRSFGVTHFDLAAFQTALEFNFFEAIPLNHTINLEELSEKVELKKEYVSRVLRILATRRMFVEIENDKFSHTSLSSLLARDEGIRAAAHMELDDMFRAASSMSDCLRQGTCDSETNAWTARFGMTMFEYYQANPIKASRFAKGMEGAARLDRHLSALIEGFPWAMLPEGSKVVDCGGGKGHASHSLAKVYPNLHFVVQDISTDMMSSGDSEADTRNRVTYMKHDFFNPQPILDADVYLIRQCIHNWDDSNAVKILRAFVPALEKCRPFTPLLINDTILPSIGSITRFEEHTIRQMDIAMLLQVGSKQRNVEEFRELLKQADVRYKIINTYQGGSMGLLVVHLIKRDN